MKEHLREALMGMRNHFLSIKANKYNEDDKDDAKPRLDSKADSDSGSDRRPDKPEADPKSKGDNSEFEKEKVEFFRTKRKPKIGHERIIGVSERKIR